MAVIKKKLLEFVKGNLKLFSGVAGLMKANNNKRNVLELIRGRLFFLVIIFSLTFAMLGVKLCKLVFSGPEVAESSQDTHYSDLQYERGEIVDRNGILIAVNLATGSLYANPKQIMDPKEAAEQLYKTLPGLDYDELLSRLESGKSFVWIKRNLTPRDQDLVNNLGIPGLYFKKEEKRVYPHERLLSHVLGYVGIDGHGLAGIEKQYDKFLLSEEAQDRPLQLSLDIRVQQILYQTLEDAMHEFRAIGGTALVMDANNGEIIGMVSLPDFNSNNVGASPVANRFNRSTLGVYEMGSIFKSFTMAMALDSGTSKMTDIVDATNPIKIAGFTISDAHPKARPLTLPEVFMYSSNIGTAKIAVIAGEKIQQKFLKKIGMLDELSLEIPEKGMPMFPKIWRKINLMTIAYGHGIAVTPVHVATGIAALVNGGMIYPATLLKRKNGAVGAERIIKKSTSEEMRKLFRLVVEEGTGKKAEVKGYLVGGKTGTAEKISGHGYSESAKLSSFVGAFPMNDPKYVIFVTLDEPKGTKETGGFATGGMVAAPAVSNIIATIGPMLGVKPVNYDSAEVKSAMQVNYQREDDVAAFDTDR